MDLHAAQNAAFQILDDLCTRRRNDLSFGMGHLIQSGKSGPHDEQNKKEEHRKRQPAGALRRPSGQRRFHLGCIGQIFGQQSA